MIKISLLSIILFVSFIVLAIYLYFIEDKNWIVIYEGSHSYSSKAKEKYAKLKASGVRCKLKTITPKFSSNGLTNKSAITTTRVLVHKKDLNKARKLIE
ncbi:hypothetical protein [Dethiothermospora halolimnae]|uniref:hypothetical protein n=1 Tax=Dethiothermospora halolimnae TaxID=3114390 RepID=UPI003CCB93EF